MVPIRSRSRRHIGVALVAALCAQVLLSGPVVAQPVSQPSVPATDVTPTAPGTMVVPYASAGWKYQQTAHDGVPGFEAISFNDAAWPSGTGAFGSGGGCAIQSSVQTAWSVNTDLLLRRHVSLRPDPFPEPVPVPDPRLSPHFLDDVAFGPYDPYSGENRPLGWLRGVEL